MQNCNEKNKIILMSGDMGLGNFILLEPVLYYFKNIKKIKIKIISFDNNAPIKYIDSLGYIDEIIHLPQFLVLNRFKILKRITHIIFLFNKLRTQRNQNIVLFGRHTYSVKNLILAFIIGGKKSYINILKDDKFIHLYRLLGCNINFYDFDSHEFYNNVELAKKITADALIEDTFHFPCALSTEVLIRPPNADYVLIQAVGGNIQLWKLWSNDNWKEIILKLVRRGVVVCLTGSNDEYAQVENLRQSVITLDGSSAELVKNLSGKLDLPTLGLYVKNAVLVITADGMLGHVAATFKTKTICLIGPGGDGRRPLNENCAVIMADCACNKSKSINRITQLKIERCGGACMNKISIDCVYDQIEYALSV